MRPLRPIPALALFLASFPLCAQAPIPVKCAISHVTLHTDQAWISRTGTIALDRPGTYHLAISGLPSGLGIEDLQISAQGPSGTRLGEMSLRSDPREIKETPDYLRYRKDLEDLERREMELELRKQTLASAQAFLQSLVKAHGDALARRMGSDLPEPGASGNLGRALEQRGAELAKIEWDIGEENRFFQEQRESLGKLEEHIRNQRQQSPTTVMAEVSLPRPGKVELTLRQRSTHASWAPAYEARLSSDRKHLELVLFAAVTQRTGEDWNGIRLEVATGSGSIRLDAPGEPFPLVLGYLEGRRPGGTAPTSANIASSLPHLRIALEGQADIPSGAEAQRFKVLGEELKPSLRFLAMARESQDVFLMADLQPTATFPLFPRAPLNLLAGSLRLGQVPLVAPALGKPLSLSFGPYPGLTARYTLISRKRGEAGTFSKDREWTFQERLEVGNATGEAIHVELADRTITSTTESVTVESSEGTTPGWEEVPEGRRIWNLDLPSGSSRSVDLKTRVRAPKTGRVLNLGDLVLEGN